MRIWFLFRAFYRLSSSDDEAQNLPSVQFLFVKEQLLAVESYLNFILILLLVGGR